MRTDAPITTLTTRANGSYVTGNTILDGQRFGVYAYLHSGAWASVSTTAKPNFMRNQDVLVSGTTEQTFTYQPTKYWPSSNKLSFLAYYPHNGAGIAMKDKNGNNYTANSTGTPKAQFTVQDNIADQIDLMYATPLPDRTAGVLNLDFKHTLARVTFSAKLKSGNVPIKILSIKISGVKNTGTLDITNGTWENIGNATSGAGEYTFNPDSIISSNTAATKFDDFSTEMQLLLQQTFEAGSTTKISITYNYGSGEETKDFSLAGTTAWSANASVNYTILLYKDDPDIKYEDAIYKIYTAKGLKAFADLVNGTGNTSAATCVGHGAFDFGFTHPAINGKLINNINLSTICGSSGANWIPIGKFGSDYSGTFDGNDKTVSNLYIDVSRGNQKDGQGLFKKLLGGSISNLNVNGTVNSGHNSAGIVSIIQGGTLKNCTFSGDVTTTGTRTGGVVGYLNNGTVENCINEGKITSGDSQTGGVVGCAESSTVKRCINKGTIKSTGHSVGIYTLVGGVVGSSSNSTITSCINTGAVSGTYSMVGGVIGYVAYNSVVTACYSTGKVNGGNNVGGVAGANNFNGTITACYSTGTVTGENAGGIVGHNGSGDSDFGKATVQYCASVSNAGTNGIGSNLGTVTKCVENSKNIRKSEGINHTGNSGTLTINGTAYSLHPDGHNGAPSIWSSSNITGGSAQGKNAPKLFWE